MAKVRIEVIEVLRKTAKAIENSNRYQWGHMGLCNCGFLAQEVTHLQKQEIHSRAMERHGDWSDQLNDYCPSSGLPMDDLISQMLAFGLDADDLKHLERLSDKNILKNLPADSRTLRHNIKEDVVCYLQTWANMLEAKLLEGISLPALDAVREST